MSGSYYHGSPDRSRWAYQAPLYDDWVHRAGYREVGSPSRSVVTYQRQPEFHHPGDYYYEPHPYGVRYISEAPTYVYRSPPRRMVYRHVPQAPPPPPPVVVAPPPPPPPPPAPVPVHAVLGLDVKYKNDGLGGLENVVVVHNIVEHGPGHKAGLQHEDVIAQWNGVHLTGRNRWVEMARSAEPGKPVRLCVYRHGVLRDVMLTPDAWKQPRHGSYRITSTRLSPSKSPSRSPSRLR